jgi:murein DD-endopeptidase MepM/ murein hydrolase activator NlpD
MISVVGIVSLGLGFYCGYRASQSSSAVQIVVASPPVEEVYPHLISPQSTLYSALLKLDVGAPTIRHIVDAAKPICDLSRILPGTQFQLFFSNTNKSELTGIKFRFSPVDILELKKNGDNWVAQKITPTVEVKVVTFSGNVSSTLWESAEEAHMDPNLISELAEIFAWQVDFSREVREDDRWRLTVEQKFINGLPIGWGSILAAEYENAGQLHAAVLFRNNGERLGYFAPDGTSLKRMFLKSPIQYARISSKFSKSRFHPILKINRPHLGVDYAAAKGTPIRAVASGVVTFAAWGGGGGNTIKLRHNSTYETAYKHLSKFGIGIHAGTHVQQGQTIGFVGTTGLSTAPHLHYEFFESGRYVDPLGKKFPSADPVPAELMAQFRSAADSCTKSLPPWESLAITQRDVKEPTPAQPQKSALLPTHSADEL